MENTAITPSGLLTTTTASIYAVPLSEATDSIASYKKVYPNVPTKAFTIHAYDLFASLGYTHDQIRQIVAAYPLPYPHARIYLGANDPTEESPLRIFLTPVQGANIGGGLNIPGTDIIPYGEFQRYPEGPVETGQFVFDLIAPCPGTCDIASPLYSAGNSGANKK